MGQTTENEDEEEDEQQSELRDDEFLLFGSRTRASNRRDVEKQQLHASTPLLPGVSVRTSADLPVRRSARPGPAAC